MILLAGIALVLIFLSLSFIHFYWALGGNWGAAAAIPTKDDNTTKMIEPSIFSTLIVALILLAFGLLVVLKTGAFTFNLPSWLSNYGLWIIAIIFSIRTVGDFKYVGCFKTVKTTTFSRYDSLIFTPLCAAITILTALIEILT